MPEQSGIGQRDPQGDPTQGLILAHPPGAPVLNRQGGGRHSRESKGDILEREHRREADEGIEHDVSPGELRTAFPAQRVHRGNHIGHGRAEHQVLKNKQTVRIACQCHRQPEKKQRVPYRVPVVVVSRDGLTKLECRIHRKAARPGGPAPYGKHCGCGEKGGDTHGGKAVSLRRGQTKPPDPAKQPGRYEIQHDGSEQRHSQNDRAGVGMQVKERNPHRHQINTEQQPIESPGFFLLQGTLPPLPNPVMSALYIA